MERKVAIVTGAGKGIGADTALKFASMGCDVVINYCSNEQAANEISEECKAFGAEALIVRGDVSKDSHCIQIAEATLKKFGRMDFLVNNAATTKFARVSDLDALQMDDFLRVFGVNVVGTYQMIRAASKWMKENGGSIVNLSSTAGINGVGSSMAYSASKGAINTLSLSLSRVLAPKIRVNVVCPGFIPTTWWRQHFDEAGFEKFHQQQIDNSLLGKVSSSADVADMVYFVATNPVLTGEILKIDAGISMGRSRARK